MIRTAFISDPAGWLMLATPELTIAVAVSDDSPIVSELWSLLTSKGDAAAALDVITRAGISTAPEFVIVSLGKRAKVLVRGGAVVKVQGSEDQTVSGVGLSSWAERSFDRVDSFTCQIGLTDVAAKVAFPLVSGVARVGWFAGNVAGVAVFAGIDAAVLAAAGTRDDEGGDPPQAELASEPDPPKVAAPQPANSALPPRIQLAEATMAAIDDEEPAEEVPPPEAVETKSSAYDHLFGETSYRTVEGAAVRPTEEGAEPTPGIEDRTVVAGDLAELRAKRRAGRGRVVESAPVRVAYFLELSTGGRELLDQTLVIGRAPQATALGGGSIPRLVTMVTPNQDISRTHAKIALEGDAVVVTDLHSRNGTIITLPGRAAQKLREGEPTVVIPGTIVDLGDGATLTVREA